MSRDSDRARYADRRARGVCVRCEAPSGVRSKCAACLLDGAERTRAAQASSRWCPRRARRPVRVEFRSRSAIVTGRAKVTPAYGDADSARADVRARGPRGRSRHAFPHDVGGGLEPRVHATDHGRVLTQGEDRPREIVPPRSLLSFSRRVENLIAWGIVPHGFPGRLTISSTCACTYAESAAR